MKTLACKLVIATVVIGITAVVPWRVSEDDNQVLAWLFAMVCQLLAIIYVAKAWNARSLTTRHTESYMNQKPRWTKEEFNRFSLLLEWTQSSSRVERMEAEMDMDEFVEIHGQDKCDAMRNYIEKRGKHADGPEVGVYA